MQKLALAGVVAAAAFSMLTGVAAASTFTIGSTAQPAGSTPQACIQTGFYAQSAGPTGTLGRCPAGGQVTQWQTDTDGANAPGRPSRWWPWRREGGLYRIEAVDNETVPSPAGGVATFTPASPMMVSAGDVFGDRRGRGRQLLLDWWKHPAGRMSSTSSARWC